MSLLDFKFKNTDFNNKKIQDLSDNPSSDGLSAAELKAYFDQIPMMMIALGKINDLIDELSGQDGASDIGATAIQGIAGITVQTILESIAAISSGLVTNIDDLVKSVTYNSTTGNFTITKFNGTTNTIETEIEKIVTNFEYDSDTKELILTYPDGTTTRIPLSDLIAEYDFVNTGTVKFSVVNHKVSASIDSTYMSQISQAVTDAQAAATNAGLSATAAAGSASSASTSASNASGYADNAEQSAEDAEGSATSASGSADDASDSATLSESWAVGGTGTRQGENTNNAKYWSEQAQHAAEGKFVTEVNGKTPSGDTSGPVTIDADDISDEDTNNKFTNETEKANWDGKSGKAISFTITLTVAGWNNNEQTISDSRFVTTGYDYIVTPVSSSNIAYSDARIVPSDITTDGEITFSCENMPATNISVNVMKVEVA